MSKPVKVKFYPTALTVNCCEPGGAAGIAADLRTFNAFGVYGCCAVSMLNGTMESAQAVSAQIEAVRSKIPVKFIKSGMTGSTEIIRAVAAAVKKYSLKLICDPAIFSAAGKKQLSDDAISAMQEELFPLASWITPNIREAELLTGKKIASVKDMSIAADELQKKFHSAVWLQGGRLAGSAATDLIAKDGKFFTVSAPIPEVHPKTEYGSSDTISSALTAMLALELPWKQAVCGSKSFVFGSLEQCVDIGPGVQVMYPATEDFIQLVKLDELEK